MGFCGFDLSCWGSFFLNYYFVQSFVSELGATFIGALLGVLTALWLNRRRESAKSKREESVSKERLVEVLRDIGTELVLNDWALELWQESERKLNDTIELSTNISMHAWKANSESGELKRIKNNVLLRNLQMNYRYYEKIISLLNKYIEYTRSIPESRKPSKELHKKIADEIKETRIINEDTTNRIHKLF